MLKSSHPEVRKSTQRLKSCLTTVALVEEMSNSLRDQLIPNHKERPIRVGIPLRLRRPTRAIASTDHKLLLT